MKNSVSPQLLRQAVARRRPAVEALFAALAECGPGNPGITRDTYGPGENRAHALVAKHAAELGLEIETDAAANTYLTLPGRDRGAPRVILGSHLDSVPHGGNYDGAAGVVAGLCAVAVLADLDFVPACNVTVMAIRAEESVWFQISYIGSRAALGTLPPNALNATRIDTARTLASHIAEAGGTPAALEESEPFLSRDNVRAFVELHIEQAPSLVEAKVPLAVGIAIPGNFRYPAATVTGKYDHVGTPRRFRHDAVLAAAEFAAGVDQIWCEEDAMGIPMAVTFGRFHTDGAAHGLTTVAGAFSFSLDVRAYDAGILNALEDQARRLAKDIESRRGVTFDLTVRADAPVAPCDPELSAGLADAAEAMGISAIRLLSPASHDAAAFGAAGIPIAMIFVRNRNGSHNPEEAMEIGDLIDGVSVLARWLLEDLA